MKRIDTATRQKVIELHKEGKEIKEIVQILNNANIKISYGSTWNIVEASRSQSKASEPSNQVDQSPSSVLNSTIPDNLMRDHSSAVDSKSSVCPLSRFIPEIKDSDLEHSKGSLSIPQEKKAINYDHRIIKNTITYMEEIDILDADSEPDIYTDPNADYDERYDGIKGERIFNYQYTNTMNPYPNTIFPNTNILFPNNFNPYPNNFNQQVSRLVVEKIKKEESDQASTSKNMLEMDWDENHEARFVKWVMDEKRRRQDEERKLQEQWSILMQEKNNVGEQKRNIEAREAKLSEVKDLIPSAQQLKEMGAQFSQVQAFMYCVRKGCSSNDR
jgi:hypothetical protein